MSNQEAIEKFKKIKKGSIFLIHQRIEGKEVIEDYSLCDMAISALQAQDSPKPTAESVQNVQDDDLVSRKAASDTVKNMRKVCDTEDINDYYDLLLAAFDVLPSAQQTLCGYDIKHLMLIAEVLRKENLPPERIIEALTDIGRIVSIVRDEFKETIRKAVEQCEI